MWWTFYGFAAVTGGTVATWTVAGAAHGEILVEHHPTTTMMEVRRLIDPDMLIEIEADAIVVPGS